MSYICLCVVYFYWIISILIRFISFKSIIVFFYGTLNYHCLPNVRNSFRLFSRFSITTSKRQHYHETKTNNYFKFKLYFCPLFFHEFNFLKSFVHYSQQRGVVRKYFLNPVFKSILRYSWIPLFTFSHPYGFVETRLETRLLPFHLVGLH